MYQMSQEGAALALLDGDTSSRQRDQAIEVIDRVKCMYCRRMVNKSELVRIPPEPGKYRNVVRLGCPACVKNIKEKRKAAKKMIRQLLGE